MWWFVQWDIETNHAIHVAAKVFDFVEKGIQVCGHNKIRQSVVKYIQTVYQVFKLVKFFASFLKFVHDNLLVATICCAHQFVVAHYITQQIDVSCQQK